MQWIAKSAGSALLAGALITVIGFGYRAQADSMAETAAVTDQPSPASAIVAAEPAALDDMEAIKTELIKLKRDLVILEEDLLYPASTQMSVFLAMDVGEFFGLDAVTVKVNGKEVAHHLYTEREADALFRGGVQKLFVGNVKQGDNRVTAFFTGKGPSGRDYKRAATVEFEKSFEPTFVELRISDSEAKYQPEFHAVVVQ
ncbi:MAG: AraC family transcriptional regulator [Pseudomonadaceae bacterium]|nr:AraC family transcriptional regulator [Pseudomonadaceae bacterium]